MTIQITVRLDEANVAFLDELVQAGEATSRAAAVDRALRQQRRDAMARHDAEIYARTEPDPEMVAWVDWTSANPFPIDDDY